jgi:cobaltochelatase CobN
MALSSLFVKFHSSHAQRRRFLVLSIALVLLVAAAALWWVSRPPGQPVVVVASDFVPGGKFATLRRIAADAGVKLRVANIDHDDSARLAEILDGAGLVVLDTPREEDGRRMQEALGDVLARTGAPWLQVTARGPRVGGGLDAARGGTLHDYYRNGTARNFAGFFAYVRHHLFGERSVAVPEPVIFPASGIYHPDHPNLVVASLSEYRSWLGAERAARRPAVGIVVHQANIGNMDIAHIDALVRRLEARGALPVVFYHPLMAETGALDIVTEAGRAAVDVMVNFQAMYQDRRRADYLRLDVPVLQAMTWREGDAAHWRASAVGVSSTAVPFALAVPEQSGLTDPLVVAAVENGHATLIPEQADALVAKLLRIARLRSTPNADKRLALMFYNYPPGEKNISASFLNVPRSLARLSQVLGAAGYSVQPVAEQTLTETLTRLMAPFYRSGQLEALLADDLAARLPLAEYRAWFDTLPASVRQRVSGHWGAPEDDPMLVGDGPGRSFVIPRLILGNLMLMPQPPRGRVGEAAEKAIYHDTKVPLTHFYMAVYLYARQSFGADALIHFGTHGSQEWTPGKERGLSVYDDPYLVLGDLPVVYPYIVDNIGEATQAKRRGRATIVTHQTPPFAPAGLHDTLTPLHDLIHQYELLDEGAVKERTRSAIVDEAARLNLLEDIGWTAERARADFKPFERELHDWLHSLAQSAQPLGLHTLGEAPATEHRIGTVMQMLGAPLYATLGLKEPDELFVDDYRNLQTSAPYRLLAEHLLQPSAAAPVNDPARAALLAEGRRYFEALSAAGEHQGLLRALEGRFIDTQYGGDPVRNPDSLPTGRNLYGFDPSRLPTEQAWRAGGEAFAQLLAAYRAEHGREMTKVTFSLWSVEAMRHLGVLEAQVFHALGVKPVWDRFGRIANVEVIPRAELGRPRVDVVVSATGLYRDHFPNVMRQIARAVEKVAALDEPDNAVRANTLALENSLLAQGFAPAEARLHALTRIFSSESGAYGTGLDDATLATDTWEAESKLAELYLARMQFAYGPDEARWGEKVARPDGAADFNLYAEHLKGTEAAVLARSSNLYGMLTTDDPFQYLGGIGLAVRHLGGATPGLYISNLRDPAQGKVESAARFLAAELRARYFHPQWIEAMQQEGYAGTLNVLDTVNNFWGWTAVAPEIVRDDQWQSFFDVYINDALNLGMEAWFERHNPTARAQIAERMLEAARKEYWQTDEATLRRLVEVYADAVARFDYKPTSSKVDDYVEALAAGFGLNLAAAPAPADSAAAAGSETVTGQVLEKQPAPEAQDTPIRWADLLLAALTLSALLAGGLRQAGQAKPLLRPLP